MSKIRITSAILAACLLGTTALCGCGGSSSNGGSSNNGTAASSAGTGASNIPEDGGFTTVDYK